MKDLSLLVWLTQLGMSTALPMAGFLFLARFLQNRFGLGSWIIWVGAGLGMIAMIDGFRTGLKAMSRLSKGKKEDTPSGSSFNEHD